jgi:DNA-binding NarL/FixJ family response regulator
MRADW